MLCLTYRPIFIMYILHFYVIIMLQEQLLLRIYCREFDNLSVLCKYCRLNFSLEDMAIASPYYRHFKSTSKGVLKFHVQQIGTDFPQYFNYDRVKELILLSFSNQ